MPSIINLNQFERFPNTGDLVQISIEFPKDYVGRKIKSIYIKNGDSGVWSTDNINYWNILIINDGLPISVDLDMKYTTKNNNNFLIPNNGSLNNKSFLNIEITFFEDQRILSLIAFRAKN